MDTYRTDYVPDGYLVSSASDMSHYLIAQLQGGIYNGTTVISHDGDSLNMHSKMIVVPALGWGVQLIINSSSIPVLMTASVDATARGVVSMVMGSHAPTSLSPVATYIAFDAVALVIVAFLRLASS